MKRYVIHYKNLPGKLPINLTGLVLLTLDRVQAHAAIWGGAIVLLSLLWGRCMVGISKQKFLNLYEQKNNRGQAQASPDK